MRYHFTPAVMAGAVLAGALLTGPATASEGADDSEGSVCGERFVLAGETKIPGPNGHERLGTIVQMTDLATHDACTYVVLKKDAGNTGTLTLTTTTTPVAVEEPPAEEPPAEEPPAEEPPAEAPVAEADEVVAPTVIDFDLDDDKLVTAPSFFDADEVATVTTTAEVTGAAYQGKQHSEKRRTVVKATPAQKKAAKAALGKANAKADRLKGKARAAAKKAAKAAYDKAVKDKVVVRTVTVQDRTPYTASATQSFVLAEAVAYVDDSDDDDDDESSDD